MLGNWSRSLPLPSSRARGINNRRLMVHVYLLPELLSHPEDRGDAFLCNTARLLPEDRGQPLLSEPQI
jgi:hypothetical protein